MNRTPVILEDDVGLVNFTLIKGCSKTIRVVMAFTDQNISAADFDFIVTFYSGRQFTETVMLSTNNTAEIIRDGNAIEMQFSAEKIEPFNNGLHQWDLRFSTGSGNGQILKGSVTIGVM